MYQGKYFPIENFKGGYCANLPPTQLQLNQANDLDNIIVKPQGLGFRSRPGTQKQHLAAKTIQDITYTSTHLGATGELVTIAYTAGATAGSEVVTVVNNAISIQIDSGNSTATQVKAKFDASAAATALATCTITGTAGTAQTAPVVAAALVTTALNSGANVQGIGYMQSSTGSESLGAIVGNKFYGDVGITGSWSDKTGSLTITSGASNTWDFTTFNNKLIGFGGPINNPDTPIQWDGTASVATALTGAPSAYGGFSANNRLFAFRTAADPSTIKWSVIGNPADFTGSGSGSAVVGSLSDNSSITAAMVLSTNYVLVFKESATYQMVISSNPFPIYTLFDKEGCAGKKAVVNNDGQAYWINLHGEMLSTNGETLQDYPKTARNLWESVLRSRFPNISGYRVHGQDYIWIVWLVTLSGSTNNYAIIWDVLNECWLKASSGFKMNINGVTIRNEVYMGGYDGFIYKPLVEGIYKDESESAPGTIDAYWRSGWLNPSSADQIIQVKKLISQYKTKASGTVAIKYGFDFVPDHVTTSLSQVPSGSEAYTSRLINLSGRGNFFQYKIGSSSSTIDTEVDGILLGGKVYGQKKIGSN